jgi:hypothetical protein
MCAGANGRLRDKEVSIYMGYYGGNLRIGDAYYTVNEDEGKVMSESEMIDLLSKYKKKELATLIVELVRDSDE